MEPVQQCQSPKKWFHTWTSRELSVLSTGVTVDGLVNSISPGLPNGTIPTIPLHRGEDTYLEPIEAPRDDPLLSPVVPVEEPVVPLVHRPDDGSSTVVLMPRGLVSYPDPPRVTGYASTSLLLFLLRILMFRYFLGLPLLLR